jgi:hypothetical protein
MALPETLAVVTLRRIPHNARSCWPGLPGVISQSSMVSRIGPLAMIRCKPRQARKGATVAADSCAGVRLVRLATHFPPFICAHPLGSKRL